MIAESVSLKLESRQQDAKLPQGCPATARCAWKSSSMVALTGTRAGLPMRAVYLFSDIFAFVTSVAVAKLAIDLFTGNFLRAVGTVDFKLFALLVIGLTAVAMAQGTYGAIPPRPVRKFRGWVLGAAAVCLALVGGSMLLNIGGATVHFTLLIGTGIAILLASFCRAICRILFGSHSWWGTRLIVVGSDELAAKIYDDLVREPQWGLRPVGIVTDVELATGGTEIGSSLGSVERLDDLAAELSVDWALVAVRSFATTGLSALLARTTGRIKHWIILPSLEQFPSLWLEACEAGRRPALSVTNRLAVRRHLVLKRAFDLATTVALGLAALPLIGVLVALIKISSPGPIFYGHERIGKGYRRFKVWKFRTMFPDADTVLAWHLAQYPELASEWRANHKLRYDPRVTSIGRLLRVTSLDELPQIWNVLMGQMSLVGPRPIVSAEIDKYAESFDHYARVVPGITGLWQVSGRNNTTYEERVALDVYYVHNWSLWLDIYILACTVKVVLLGEGAR